MTMAMIEKQCLFKEKNYSTASTLLNSRFFFLKIGLAQLKSLTPEARQAQKKSVSPQSRTFFSLAPDLLFDCSRELERQNMDCFAVGLHCK